MVVVTGHEPLVVTSTFAALGDFDLRAHGAVSGGDDSEELFEQLFELEATAIVVIEPLLWGGSGAPDRNDGLLERCLSAARVPQRPRFVWVTHRDAGDPAIERIQRAGVPYVILSVAPLIQIEAKALLSERTVLVPNTLSAPHRGVATPELAGRAVARAILDDECLGRIESVGLHGHDTWRRLITELGGEAEVVSSWRAHVGRLFGRPVLQWDGSRVQLRSLGFGTETEAEGSRPEVS